MPPDRTVFVIDDDANLRDSVCALANSMGCCARGFDSAEAFLAAHAAKERGVVVVDLRMPGMSGLELQEELARRHCRMPVIVLSAYARTPITVRAMQAGAVTIIDKPYHDDDLWNAIRAALEQEEAVWKAEQQRDEILSRIATLTSEERRVAELIVAGRANKSVSHDLGLSLRTIEKRRHDLLMKMKADSVAELVRLWIAAEAAK